MTNLHGPTFADWRSELDAQTDRGAAIIGASFLEARLEEAIRARFVGTGEPTDALFHGNAPLATLSAKIDMGFALGLYGSKVHRDLNLMRRIRNKFAHKYVSITFDSPDIRSQCAELWLAASMKDYETEPMEDSETEPKTPREMFMNTLLLAFHLLMTEMKDNRPQLNQPKFLP